MRVIEECPTCGSDVPENEDCSVCAAKVVVVPEVSGMKFNGHEVFEFVPVTEVEGALCKACGGSGRQT